MKALTTIATLAAVALLSTGAVAQTMHQHGEASRCVGAGLECATKATPYFAADGTLWLAWMADGRVSVARSSDLGRSFTPPVAVNPEPLSLDWGPDARPKLVVDREGRVVVAFAIFKDKAFNGQVLFSRSSDGGQHFAAPRAITSNPESQRFEGLALDSDGALFAAWLDKRNRVLARPGEKYAGAGLAFAWSHDGGDTFTEARIAHDNTCECCRLAIAFAGPHRPVVMFRNIFDGTTRDHAVLAFDERSVPGEIHRVSVDGWKTDVCPHHGPSLSIAADGAYHVAWFTNGQNRQGLFYANSRDAGRTFSAPMPIGNGERQPSRPYVLAARGSVWLAWKEFDGKMTTVNLMQSRDDGQTWSKPRVLATTMKQSDHPLLVTNGATVFLSWLTSTDGYKLIPLEATQ